MDAYLLIELSRHMRTIGTDSLTVFNTVQVDVPNSIQGIDGAQEKDDEAKVERVVQCPEDSNDGSEQ